MKRMIVSLLLVGSIFQIAANEALEKGISFALGTASGLGIGLAAQATHEYMHSAGTVAQEIALSAPCTRLEIFIRYPEYAKSETIFNYLAKATGHLMDQASEFVKSPAVQERMHYLSENQDALIAVGLVLSYFGLLAWLEETNKKQREGHQSVYEYSSLRYSEPFKVPSLNPIPASYASIEVYEPGVIEKGTNPDTVEIVNGICVSTWKSPK